MFRRMFQTVAVCLFAATLATEARAATIVINTAGGGDLIQTTYLGQSVTTPVGPGWTDIEFAFLDGLTPVAAGDLFVLTAEYLGTPNALSNATPGFLGQSTGISGGFWNFDSSVSLLPTTQYWFYSNAQFVPGDITGDGNVYAGGQFYGNWLNGGTGNDPFHARPTEDADFQLNGTPIPEPMSLILFGTGLAGAWRARRRQ